MVAINQLQMLVAVVDQGNFTKAADALDITPMAVSKQISALEQELGITLFERTTRQIRITDTGKTIYEKALALLANHNELIDYAATLHETPQGLLRVACTVSTSKYMLIPKLAAFMQLYPKLTIDLCLLDQHSNFDIEHFDVIVGVPLDSLGEGYNELISVPIFKTRRQLYASSSYLKQHGRPKKLTDLKQHYYISHSGRIHDGLIELCNNKNIKLQELITVNNTQAMAQCCRQGLGLALIADFIINNDKNYSELVNLDELYQEPTVSVHMLYRQQRYLQPKVYCFKEFMRQALA